MSLTHEEQRTDRQREIDERVLERVKRGIAFLQEQHGDDWVDKIDMKTLNLASGSCCVLGQVYREDSQWDDGYCWAIEHFPELVDDEGASFGFTTDDEDYNSGDRPWDNLQKTWEYVLTPLVSKNG